MSMSLREISDRLELQDLMVSYCSMVDRKEWERMSSVFTPDAYIDYTASCGVSGNCTEIREFLENAMALFSVTQHMVSNFEVALDDDKASARVMLHNPMIMGEGDHAKTQFGGLWYLLEFSNDGQSWRIQKLSQEAGYVVSDL